MPYCRIPANIRPTIRLLIKARDMWKLTEDPTQRAITDDHFRQIDDADPDNLLSRILTADDKLRTAKATRAHAAAEVATLRRSLIIHVTHFHRVLDMAIERARIPAPARAHYGRDIATTALPPLNRHSQIITSAEKILTGETTRQQAEGPSHIPMTNPSPAEIAPILTAYQAALNTLLSAKIETNALQETITNRRKELTALARDIIETIRFHHRKDPDPASRRAKNELWGITYNHTPPKRKMTAPIPPP